MIQARVHFAIRPVELATANEFVARHHRHHKPAVGHRFSVGCFDGARLCGVAIVGRPVARMVDQTTVVEVTRLCTDGTANACSCLYAACARAAKALGYSKIQTYILGSELGTSLKASGWVDEGEAGGGQWHHSNEGTGLFGGPNRRTDQPTETKRRWAKRLAPGREVA